MNRTIQLASKILFAVFLLLVLDAALYTIYDTGGDVRALPGSRQPVVGKLVRPIFEHYNVGNPENPDKREAEHRLLNEKLLAYKSPSPDLTLDFTSVQGRVWMGVLDVREGAAPGVFNIPVSAQGEDTAQEGALLKVQLFATPEDMRASYISPTMRLLGFSPWWLLGGVLAVAGAGLAHIFRVNNREDAQRQQQGLGPIYKLALRKTGWEVTFGLGRKNGIQDGDRMVLLDPDMNLLTEFTACKVGSEAAQATVPLDVAITPDCLVSKPRS